MFMKIGILLIPWELSDHTFVHIGHLRIVNHTPSNNFKETLLNFMFAK